MSRKHVKLPPSKEAKKRKADKGGEFYFFVKDQGEGAGKIAVILLKLVELVLTTIFAAVLGIFAPLCIWLGDFVPEDIAASPAAGWWLASSIVYIIGLFAVMLGHSKTAAVIHVFAGAGTLITYSFFTQLYEGYEVNAPTALFMPAIFIPVVTISIMLIINVPKWIDRHIAKMNEVAPSILGDGNVKNSKKNKE